MVYLPSIYHKNQPNVGKYISPMDPMGMTVQPSGLWDVAIFAQGIDSTGMLEGIRGGAECVVVLINNGWPIESKGGAAWTSVVKLWKPPRARIQICPKISGFAL